MENRSQIVQEFFELIVYLNKGNTKANTKTELIFDIRPSLKEKSELEFIVYLKGIKNPKSLVFCKKRGKQLWITANFTKFIDIEDFCCAQLNIDSNLDKNTLIKNIILKLKSFGIIQK